MSNECFNHRTEEDTTPTAGSRWKFLANAVLFFSFWNDILIPFTTGLLYLLGSKPSFRHTVCWQDGPQSRLDLQTKHDQHKRKPLLKRDERRNRQLVCVNKTLNISNQQSPGQVKQRNVWRPRRCILGDLHVRFLEHQVKVKVCACLLFGLHENDINGQVFFLQTRLKVREHIFLYIWNVKVIKIYQITSLNK